MPGYSRRQAPLGSIDNKDGQFTYSNLEDLETTEHSTLASRSSKVQMVNMAADTINAFSPGRPVTFISVGSGHLQHFPNELDRTSVASFHCYPIKRPLSS